MRWLTLEITLLLAFGLAGEALAGSSARHTVTVRVLPRTQMSITGSNISIPSSNPDKTVNSSPMAQTSPAIFLNWHSIAPAGYTKKITAQLYEDGISGIALKAKLARPNGSDQISEDYTTLGPDAVDMLMGIGNENCTGANIIYAVFPSGTLPHSNKVVTVVWTITDADGTD